MRNYALQRLDMVVGKTETNLYQRKIVFFLMDIMCSISFLGDKIVGRIVLTILLRETLTMGYLPLITAVLIGVQAQLQIHFL